ncbi:MAG TPA: hypothetical protein VL068_13865 [Microthrixaceae bacterium]|nr:hypothetical protein [Microthrixaceae bacterium]
MSERDEISVALIENPRVSWVEIARRIERHPTTVARGVTGHGGRAKHRPASADREAQKAKRRPRQRLGGMLVELRDRIAGELGDGRSPEAIWADLRAEKVKDVPC